MEMQTPKEIRRARLIRLGVIRQCPLVSSWEVPYWAGMWFGDLVFGKPRGIAVEYRPGEPIAVRDIQEKVCKHFGLTVPLLISHSRVKEVVLPRQIGMYLAHLYSKCSVSQITKKFGLRDHSTGIYAIRKIKAAVAADDPVVADIQALKCALGIIR